MPLNIRNYLMYGMVALLAVVGFAATAEPYSRQDSHFYRMLLAGFLGIAFLLRIVVPAAARRVGETVSVWAKHVYLSMLIVAFVFGIFNYYQFDRKWVEGFDDYTDITYYYMNTKYLDELGYYGLYAAMLTADRENQNRHATRIATYRDLRDYVVKPVSVAFTHGEEIKKNNFSPERWKAFSQDIDFFLARKTLANMRENFYVDHGYNPPTTWTVLATPLVKLADVEHLKYIASVDVLIVAAMLIVAGWAFGLEASLFLGIFFVCTFSGRWPVVSHALLRFDWVAALVISMALLKKEKYAASGGFMAFAALSRVFPAIFFFAWIVTAAAQLFRTRKVAGVDLRFLSGAAGTVVFFLLCTVAMYGLSTFIESIQNILMHSNTYSSQRVGLSSVFVYQGEMTRQDIAASGGIYPKEMRVHELTPYLRLIGLGTLAFIAVYIVRTGRSLLETVHLSAMAMFCVTHAQMNYYNLRTLLVLFHITQVKKNPVYHGVAMVLLMGTEVVGHYLQVGEYPRYVTTTFTSHGMLFYYGFTVLWMAYQMIVPARSAAAPSSR